MMNNLIYLVIGYLLGSIPFALVVGQLFYQKDVRHHGSGNLGATNAGRVLGKKIGAIVTILDVLKGSVAILIAQHLNLGGIPDLVGIGLVLGHCFPLFAKFKGGKAVAVTYGFLLGANFTLFLITFAIFLMILKLTKYVSVASMASLIIACLMAPLFNFKITQLLILIVMCLIVIIRHKDNLKRLNEGIERKVTWI